jgi:exosortase A
VILVRDPVWRRYLIRLALVIAALLLLFARDAGAMAAIWWNVSTYNHCLFIVPLVGWLAWQRRDEVLALTPASCWPGLALVLAGGLLWMLGQAAGIALFRHAGLVFMIQSSVLVLLGPNVTRGLLFPLFYLVFLVPFGDELVPVLQTVTAKLCMVFLGWGGVPAQIDGVFISTPTGAFEVAEACSGVKFLVAMIAYAALAANVCFKSWPCRIAFVAMAVIVSILANGVRAYATIHISYVTGNNRFAEGFDHIIFGWIFFAVILALVMAIAWRFFDRGIDDPWLEGWLGRDARRAAPARWPVAMALVATALLPVGWQAALASWGHNDATHAIALPDVPDWKRVPVVQAFPWRPRFDGADQLLIGEYRDASGNRVDLSIAIYGWQAEGREIVGYAQGPFDPESRWSWANDTRAPDKGAAIRIFAPGVEREAVTFYRIGGITTGSAAQVKFETLKAKLLGRSQVAVAILVSAENSRDRPSRPAIDAFLHDLGPVGPLADKAALHAAGQ